MKAKRDRPAMERRGGIRIVKLRCASACRREGDEMRSCGRYSQSEEEVDGRMVGTL